MRRLTPSDLPSYVGKEIRVVYVKEAPYTGGGVIEVDHKITPPVKLRQFFPPSQAEIERANGQLEKINFTEIWDPNAVKPMIAKES